MHDTSKKYHKCLAEYFTAQKETSRRKIDELLWQLQKAENWNGLIEQLRHVQFVQAVWGKDKFEVTSSWSKLEAVLPGSMLNAYGFILNNVDGYIFFAGQHEGVADFLLHLAETLHCCGYFNEAFGLCDGVLKYFSDLDFSYFYRAVMFQVVLFHARGKKGDLQTAWQLLLNIRAMAIAHRKRSILLAIMSAQESILLECKQNEEALHISKEHKQLAQEMKDYTSLSDCLGNEAIAFVQMGEVEQANNAHKEEERLCRELGDLNRLQACLCNQSTLLMEQSKLDDALRLLKEQEKICDQIGKMTSLANCYSNQAYIYAKMGERNKAKELLQHQESLARKMGSDKQIHIALEAQERLELM